MAAVPPSDPLCISWHDSSLIPFLDSPSYVMTYFSEKSNPFYDRNSSNEVIRMQRLDQHHLSNLTGVEYVLLHMQPPILYVVRKQHRHSRELCTPLADYYIIGGRVYQAPDLSSVVNARLLNCISHLQSSFDEVKKFARFHPSKGYSWDFKDTRGAKQTKESPEKKEEPSSAFQRQRVDILLSNWIKNFPPRIVPVISAEKSEEQIKVKSEPLIEIKNEKPEETKRPSDSHITAPAAKKPKLLR